MLLNESKNLLDKEVWTGRLFDGDWISPKGGTYQIVEPATGDTMTTVGLANKQDINIACEAAKEAQIGWSKLPSRERAKYLRNAADVLDHHSEELSRYVARETGGIFPKGQHEVREAASLLHLAAATAISSRGEILQSQKVETLSLARRVPRGVVGIISPFNFPLILSMRAIAPALSCGNSVVIKPDPQTAISGGYLIARIFEEVGLPKGVLQVLPGEAEAGEALCVNPDVDMIQFTGSAAVGRRVGELAGKHLKKVSLELGGNNALIILDDADIDSAVNNATWGAFLHQGQICMASSRIFVQESISQEFTQRFAEKINHLPVGNPSTDQVALGPVINAKQLERIQALIADTVSAGAKVEVGAKNNGLFHEATVISGVKPGMRLFDEECFGPVASIITFKDDAEALALANQHQGSLAAGVMSQSVGRAMAMANQLKSGLVHVNDQTVNDEGNNPFGAPGVAGAGSSVGGPADIEEYTRWQWYTIKAEPPKYPF